MATTPKETITLDGSGEATVTLADSFQGYLLGFMIDENGQTNNPALVVTEVGSLNRTLMSLTHTATGATYYPVRELLSETDGTTAGEYGKFLIESQIQVVVTGGDNDGTLFIQAQYEPVQR